MSALTTCVHAMLTLKRLRNSAVAAISTSIGPQVWRLRDTPRFSHSYCPLLTPFVCFIFSTSAPAQTPQTKQSGNKTRRERQRRLLRREEVCKGVIRTTISRPSKLHDHKSTPAEYNSVTITLAISPLAINVVRTPKHSKVPSPPEWITGISRRRGRL